MLIRGSRLVIFSIRSLVQEWWGMHPNMAQPIAVPVELATWHLPAKASSPPIRGSMHLRGSKSVSRYRHPEPADQFVSPDIRSLGEVAAVPEQFGEGAVQGFMPACQGGRPSWGLRPYFHFPAGVEGFPSMPPLDHERVHRFFAQPDVVDHLGYEDAHFGGRLVRLWRL